MTNAYSLLPATVHLAFLALFPGFFFYHTALGRGLVNPVFGGYFSPVALAFLPILLFIYLSRVRRDMRFFTKADLMFFAFILYFFFTVALNFGFGAKREVAQNHLLSIVHLVVVFIVFRMAAFQSNRIRLATLGCLLCMTAIVYTMSIDGLFYLKQQSQSDDSQSLATYQGFARSYLLTFLVAAPFVKSLPFRLFLYCNAVPALFLNGARSELMAVVALIPMIELYHARYRLLVVCLALAIASVCIFLSGDIIAVLPTNRSLEVLDLANSASWESRDFLFSAALATIAEHPFAGDYGSYYYIFGNAGSNAHNIFSAWVDLGVFGFLFILCMTTIPMVLLARDFLVLPVRQRTEHLLLAFGLMFVALLLLLTAKSFTYVLIAAALGRFAHYRHENGRAQNAPPDLRTRAKRHPNLYRVVP